MKQNNTNVLEYITVSSVWNYCLYFSI